MKKFIHFLFSSSIHSFLCLCQQKIFSFCFEFSFYLTGLARHINHPVARDSTFITVIIILTAFFILLGWDSPSSLSSFSSCRLSRKSLVQIIKQRFKTIESHPWMIVSHILFFCISHACYRSISSNSVLTLPHSRNTEIAEFGLSQMLAKIKLSPNRGNILIMNLLQTISFHI